MNPHSPNSSPSSSSSGDDSAARREPAPHAAPTDAWLEAALRETARDHIDDAGFTARVREQLPARKGRPLLRRRQVVFAVAVGLAAAVAAPFLSIADLSAAHQHLAEAVRPVIEIVPLTESTIPYIGCSIAVGFLVLAVRQFAKARS